MSIFRKASDLESLPDSVNKAYFNNSEIDLGDEFQSLLKEAATNRSLYENRIKAFKSAQAETSHEFTAPMPAKYADLPGGIRRAGYGQRFEDERSELFGAEKIKNIAYDNNKYAESLLNNGFSIWEPEFDELQDAFQKSQSAQDAIFDRRTAAEKKAAAHQNWENQQKSQIRTSKVLPYRGLGVCRFANEEPIHHGKFNTFDEFYADTQDSIREMIRESNEDRKTKIQRKGVDPRERKDQWENKEAIAARTMHSIYNNSFLDKFAEDITEEITLNG